VEVADIDFLVIFGQELRDHLHVILWSRKRPMIGGAIKIDIPRANSFLMELFCLLASFIDSPPPSIPELCGFVQVLLGLVFLFRDRCRGYS
jgi:hypothetical protein